jgi:cytochrome c peroxidase
MKKDLLLPLLASIALIVVVGWNYLSIPGVPAWSEEERRLIASLSLDSLPPLPSDPSNLVADEPAAAEFGHRLYFDTRLSSNGQVACATCHKPELMFTDGLALAVGVGIGPMHTPSLVGLSYSPWFYWDGRKDSQWAQALAPLEAKHEHATDRVQLLHLISSDTVYRDMYENVFGPLSLHTRRRCSAESKLECAGHRKANGHLSILCKPRQSNRSLRAKNTTWQHSLR